MNTDLEMSLKTMIIENLGLEDIREEDIDSQAALFGDDGLGLDSVDALELGLAIQKNFNIQIDNNSQEIKQHFFSIKTLAEYIRLTIREK